MLRLTHIAPLALLLCGQAWATTRYCTPAERERGCVWADRFESQALVERNGGSVTGSPTFSARDGVTLDGTTDRLTYGLMGHEARSSMTWQIEFTPDFAYDEDAVRYLAEAANAGGTAGHSVFKRNNASNNTLDVYMNSTLIAQIPSATYSPHWRQGQRNILVVSSESGDTDAWLNGTQILTDDVTGWTDITAGSVYVGSSRAGTSPFDGTIHRVQIYNQKLSDLECEQISSGTVYSYPQGTVWDFTVAHGLSDASGSNTLTAYNAPTKLDAHGYEFDGVNQYLQGALTTTDFNNAEFSTVFEFAPGVTADEAVRRLFWEADDGTGSGRTFLGHYGVVNVYRLTINDTVIDSIPDATVAAYWRQDQRNVLVLSAKSGDTSVWLNGVTMTNSDPTPFTTPAGLDRLTIGCTYAGGNFYSGKVYSFHVLPTQLSRMQAVDITLRLLKQANRK